MSRKFSFTCSSNFSLSQPQTIFISMSDLHPICLHISFCPVTYSDPKITREDYERRIASDVFKTSDETKAWTSPNFPLTQPSPFYRFSWTYFFFFLIRKQNWEKLSNALASPFIFFHLLFEFIVRCIFIRFIYFFYCPLGLAFIIFLILFPFI